MKKDGEKITVKFYLDYFSVDDKRELSVVKNGESVKVRILRDLIF